MLRSLPDLNIKQNRTRVTISIVRRTLCHDPRSYQIQQLQRTQYVVPTRLVARLRLLALRGKERSSTNWEWLEVAVPVQDTRPHLSWDRTTFFFIGATRPHLLTITTFNFWQLPPPPGDEGPKIRTGQRFFKIIYHLSSHRETSTTAL